MLKKKKSKFFAFLNHASRLTKISFKISPSRFILTQSVFLIDGFIAMFSILVLKNLFETVAKLSNGETQITEAMIAVALLFLMNMCSQALKSVDNYLGETFDLTLRGRLTEIANIKIGKIDVLEFESSKFLDLKKRSYEGIRYAIQSYNTFTDVLIYYIPYFAFVSIFLFSLRPILALSILLIFLPLALSLYLKGKVFKKHNQDTVVMERQMDHYKDCLLHKEYVRETHTIGLHSYFLSHFKKVLSEVTISRVHTELKSSRTELLLQSISIFAYIAIIYLLYDSLVKGFISIGEFAAVYASIEGLFANMEGLLVWRIGVNAKNYDKVENYFNLLEQDEKYDTDERLELSDYDVKLDQVAFTYPLTDKRVLNDISLQIKSGEKIAIVGANGSGKSTLCKIMMGLYKPTTGITSYGDKNIHESKSKDIFKATSVLFQDFQRYQLTLLDNISLSDTQIEEENYERMNKKVKQLYEIDNDLYTNGWQTMLSKEFNGINLSGGQWQKIALARAQFKESQIVFFDEPTSAIDPIEEQSIYETLIDFTRDKTLIVVTHRLASVKQMDKVLLLDNGRLVGFDHHDQLLQSSQLYKQMWDMQARSFA